MATAAGRRAPSNELRHLLHAKFGKLDAALADWDTLIKNLHGLEKSANDGMKSTAVNSDWSGKNQAVTKKFIVKTVGEFADAHTQATSIRNILRDTLGELRGCKGDLDDAIGRAAARHITVRASGAGFVVEAAEGEAGKDVTQGDVDGVRGEIDGIIGRAGTSDSSAAKVLRALVDQPEKGFGDASYKDRDQAADAVRKGEELAALAKKDVSKLTPAEFDTLLNGLGKYANDDLFATTFADELGARGTLEFWTGFNDPRTHDGVADGKRFDKFAQLQKNLSLTLANATQSGSADMTRWKTDMLTAVDRPVGLGHLPGYVALSNLMRWGDYEDDFLTTYGSNMIAKEREAVRRGDDPKDIWKPYGGGDWAQLNATGTDHGLDPMTGYLKALSNSPDAATAFFNEKDGAGKDPAALANFHYLFEERDWVPDHDASGDSSIAGRNYLAAALEAGTTGHPAGQLPTAETPAHSTEQAALMSAIVHSVSMDPDRLLGKGYMSDSLGHIASEYLPDINRTRTDDENAPGIKNLFPVAGSPARMDHADITRFLVAAGQDPEAHSAISVGQQTYMAGLMDHHLNPDLPTAARYSDDPRETVESITKYSAEITGTLAIGQQEAIFNEGADADDNFDYAINQRKNLISGTLGTATGLGTALIASPVAGAAVGGGVGTVTSMAIEAMFNDEEGNALADTAHHGATVWEHSKRGQQYLSSTAGTTAAKAYGADYADEVRQWARNGVEDGFDNASTNAWRMAKDMDTDFSD